MTVRELINELLQYDPGVKISFINCKKANDYLSFIKTERETDEWIAIYLEDIREGEKEK